MLNATLVLYSLSITALFLPQRLYYIGGRIPVWSVTLLLTIIGALLIELIKPLACLWLVAFAFTCYLAAKPQKNLTVRITLNSLLILFALALGFHILPGFHSISLISNYPVSEQSTSYSMAFNLDKAIVGFFIVAYLIKQPALSITQWTGQLKKFVVYFTVLCIVVYTIAILSNYIAFDPKIPGIFWLWAWHNLLVTCFTEEAFFRGLIQQKLTAALKNYQHAGVFAIVVSALLFGIAHFGGGLHYVLLSTIAGLGYGYIYYRSKRIELAILAHFSLNLTHIIFFTYPQLAR